MLVLCTAVNYLSRTSLPLYGCSVLALTVVGASYQLSSQKVGRHYSSLSAVHFFKHLISTLCEKIWVEYGFKLFLPCFAETPVESFETAGWVLLETQRSSSVLFFRNLQMYHSAVIMGKAL